MELRTNLVLFSALVVAVGVVRLVELELSRRHQAALLALGASQVREPYFRIMVALHGAILVGCLAESWLRARRPDFGVSVSLLGIVVAANLLRWWVIATLGRHWNVQIMASMPLGVVTGGPFRFVRHPNYVAVFLELSALPLLGGAWLTALVGAAVHAFVLHHRIRCEETMLLADVEYRARMGHKPRFIPGLL